jgi:streptogramin lyase
VDSGGNVFVADKFNNVIRKITPAGVVSTFAGGGPGLCPTAPARRPASIIPTGVAVDSSGNVFVTDQYNNVIRKITPAGVVSTFAGSGSPGVVNGGGTAASFHYPTGIAVDSGGNVFVAEPANNVIRKITPAGVVSTFAGGTAGFVNGTGSAASFYYPEGVAVDSSGNVFVGDALNNAIRKITPAGIVSTFAGNGTQGFVNGTGAAASFLTPTGVAVDSIGNVIVADQNNHALRKITP